ncbi:MAG: hotdog fold domain-containing protein [Candidatus Thiodiazotropha endolucinida]
MSGETQSRPVITPEARVVSLWRRFGNNALGRRIYSLLFGRLVPYTGTIRPVIEEISPGRARVTLRDRRVLRNHLNSIHAIALANVGELASGLALIASMPESTKGIVTRLEIDYLKKARGDLTAIGEAQVPETIGESTTLQVHATIWDREGDSVANLTTHWQLRPRDMP